MESLGERQRHALERPGAHPLLEPRWHVWYGRYPRGPAGRACQGAPVCSTQSTPSSTARGSRHGRPRPSARRRGAGNSGPTTAHSASVNRRTMLHLTRRRPTSPHIQDHL